jgi:GLPGLI family protein
MKSNHFQWLINQSVFIIFLMFLSTTVQAQKDFQGLVVYESKTSTKSMSFGGSNREITPEMQKTIEERMKKLTEKTYNLYFDKSASIYEEEEKLEAGGTQNSGMRIFSSFTGGGGKLYKNVKDKTYAVDKELMGKEFLVKDTLAKLNWKLESETKQIGNYLCYKATAIQPVSKSDFRNIRRKEPNASEPKKEDKTKATNFMDQMEMPKEITITAWYTPDIPVNQGPEIYWGLPGLILEVNTGVTTILCSKVVLNTKEKKEIKAPTKGKVVTQKEYDDIVVKKMEEMREQFKNGGGRPGFRMGN